MNVQIQLYAGLGHELRGEGVASCPDMGIDKSRFRRQEDDSYNIADLNGPSQAAMKNKDKVLNWDYLKESYEC